MTIPALTEAHVRDLVGAESVRRARPYVNASAMLHTRRIGDALHALCEGSRQEPYRVHARVAEDALLHARCTCPVGGAGRCKHVAAMLLWWSASPESFITQEDPKKLLATHSRAELEGMLLHTLRLHPELEVLLRMRFPDPARVDASADPAPVDPEPYREHVESLIRPHLDGLAAASQLAGGLRPVFALASAFQEDGDLATASTIHGVLVRALMTALPRVRDDEGDIRATLEHALGGMLATLDDPDLPAHAHHEALAIVLEVVILDLTPELTERARALLLEHTAEAERRDLARQLRQHLRQQRGHDQAGEPDHPLLLLLEQSSLSAEVFRTRCRELGLLDLLIEHMLRDGLVTDAADEARTATQEHFVSLLDEFTLRGHADAIEPVVRDRYAETADLRLLSWLETRHIERGDTQAALAAAQALFWRDPNLRSYLDVRTCAVEAELWSMLRPGMLASLRERGDTTTLVHAYLADGAPEAAFNALSSARQRGLSLPPDVHTLELAIASAAEDPLPALAARLFAREAQRLIEHRSLGAFQHAARYLQTVHRLATTRVPASEPDASWPDLFARHVAPYLHLQGLPEALDDADVPTP